MQTEETLIVQTKSRGGDGRGVTYEPSDSRMNVNQVERIVSLVGGGLLLKRNLTNLSLPGILKMIAGGSLLRRGLSGHCNLYQALKINSAKGTEHRFPGASQNAIPLRAQMSVAIPHYEAYELWRDPANQRWIMGHFAKVDAISMDRAHWMLRSPIGLEWDALIVADSPGEFISWESLPGAGVPNEGKLRFAPTETGGTRLIYEARFDPPAGPMAMGLMRLVGITPEAVIGKALRRFKDMAEMGITRSSPGPARTARANKSQS